VSDWCEHVFFASHPSARENENTGSKKNKGSKKKGPLLMKKRPKSREETPKEGSSNARSATAPQQYAAATHKAQELLSRFPCKTHMAQLLTQKPRFSFFDKEFQ
jgi:uncharacterized Zn-finger protein